MSKQSKKPTQHLMQLPTITREEIETLQQANHVVFIYPRKQVVSVDGFKKYRIVGPKT